ncbi:hypothetical protein J7L68_10215 [bacterium]|nr:hypothetical protein [bacterium]
MSNTNSEKNPLAKWFDSYYEKVKAIIVAENLTIHQIPDFFLYDNLSKKYPDFCPLYKSGEFCHSGIERKKICCLFCGCPFYDYSIWDDKRKIFGGCSINSKFGFRLENGFWDCTNCNFVHNLDWIKSNRKVIEELLTKNGDL